MTRAIVNFLVNLLIIGFAGYGASEFAIQQPLGSPTSWILAAIAFMAIVLQLSDELAKDMLDIWIGYKTSKV